jgi:hypothetical protein
LRTGGCGGEGGGAGAAGLTGLATAFGFIDFGDFEGAVRADGRVVVDLEGRRRSVRARFFVTGAGLRAEVRDLLTRRDFAIDTVGLPRIPASGRRFPALARWSWLMAAEARRSARRAGGTGWDSNKSFANGSRSYGNFRN